MEDLDMRHALRRYVEAGEPPFSLTAHALISEGRRRQRWRVGLGIGGGGAATTLAIVSAITLVPVGAGGPTLGSGCDVELPVRAGATGAPPTAYPTEPPHAPTVGPTVTPAVGATPTSTPTPVATGIGQLPMYGSEIDPGDRTVIAAVDQARLDEMSCFLKRRLLELLPGAGFVPDRGAPMDVLFNDRTKAYEASVYVIDGPLQCLIKVAVARGARSPDSWFTRDGYRAMATVRTGSSTVIVIVEGGAITDDQAKQIAGAREVDLFR